MQYECKEDGVMPEDFMKAVELGAEVQVNTYSILGWLTVEPEDLQFRVGVDYRIKPV